MLASSRLEAGSPRLLDQPGNPAPEGAELRAVVTADAIRLRVASWHPAGPARGTVLLMQGRAEFIEKYFEVAGELLERGFAVVTFDWRGQGGSGRSLSDRQKGHVVRFADFRQDVEAVAR
ncbi:MAG: alpha/beta hydrolase, partial [Methylobacteriaceae bacterium]|nr:alpha/beta hydrolase [Methylobacteriaceae bacterium]